MHASKHLRGLFSGSILIRGLYASREYSCAGEDVRMYVSMVGCQQLYLWQHSSYYGFMEDILWCVPAFKGQGVCSSHSCVALNSELFWKHDIYTKILHTRLHSLEAPNWVCVFMY